MEIESLSEKEENQIIVRRLFASGYDAKAIMDLEIVGLSRSTVYHQVDKLKKGQEIGFKQGSSPPRKLEDESVLFILDLLEDFPESSCSDIAIRLEEVLDIVVSVETVRRLLVDLGLSYQDPKSSFFLSDFHKEERRKWALNHKDKDWHKVIFSDETTFWLGRSGIARWKPKGEENLHMVSKNVPKVNVWGAISYNGKLSLKMFRENLDSSLYVEILGEKLGEMRQLYRYVSGWTYQQDNDPKHTANKTNKWFSDNRVKKLPWPASSPDLNPIENVWGKMKKDIGKMKPKNLEELEDSIEDLWGLISLEYVQNLIDSMPKRCKEVIEMNGERILY